MSRESSDNELEVEELPSDEAFEKVELRVQEIQDILKHESLRIRKEKEAFDSVAKKLKHVHFSSTVKLNIGGKIFTTSLQTLTKDAGSMLHAMFSGRFDTKPAEDGSYFIDRDGTHFRYLLNYLRTGELLLPEDKLVKREVLEEAKFYQIQGIIDELNPEPYSNSVILSSDQRRWLADVHGDERTFTDCTLLYRATKDGWSASAFHLKCDPFLGATMVVIKSKEGYIFGGYTERNWSARKTVDEDDEGGVNKLDWEAFLFSLISPHGTTPIQLKVTEKANQAVHCSSTHGPRFGGKCGYADDDLIIPAYPNTQPCTVNLGGTFKHPEDLSSNFLTGSKNFTVFFNSKPTSIHRNSQRVNFEVWEACVTKGKSRYVWPFVPNFSHHVTVLLSFFNSCVY